MIISFLIKHFRTILDALIIAAVVVAFSFFDPFNWFHSKVKIRNTPVAVESIRQIGQLITAEYYGETIASLPQSNTVPMEPEQINAEGQAVFNQLITDLDSLEVLEKGGKSSYKIKEKNIEDRMWENFPWLTRNRMYTLMLNYLKDTIKTRSNKNYDRKEVLWKLYKTGKITEGYLLIDKKFQLKGFYAFVNKVEKNQLKEIRKNIVYLGRGWVKAGIDFGILKAENISFSTESKTIYIKDCETKILDCDINPWFIPGKVKGYELIKEKGSFKNPFAEAVKVKKQCIENLRVQAIKNGILEQAHQNAKESLKNLFSLLTGSEITEVVFTRNKFDRILEEISVDKKISDPEAVLINELVQKSLTETDTLNYNDYRRQLSDLRDFCKSIGQYKYAGTTVNAYSLDVAAFIKNDTINPFQLNKVSAILSPASLCDSIGIKNAMFRFMADYNMLSNDFTDSCRNAGIINTGQSDWEHKLSGITKIYRDSIFSEALNLCTETLKKPANRYAVWFSTEAECDSARARVCRHLKISNPDFQIN